MNQSLHLQLPAEEHLTGLGGESVPLYDGPTRASANALPMGARILAAPR